MFKSLFSCCRGKQEAEERTTEDGNRRVVKENAKDGTTTAPTIIKPTIIKPTIIKPVINPTPTDKQTNPSKATSLPPETTTPTIIKPTIIKPTIIKPVINPTPTDKQTNPPKATSLPPETTTPTIIKPTIIKPTIIKPTIIKPVIKPTATDTPLLPPDATDVPASSKQGTASSSEFEIDCLNEHNRLRALHGCPPLILNPKLSARSKDWAIHMADTNTMKHSEENTYGENLYMSSGFTLHGSRPVQSWYREIKDYNFQKPGFSPATGHFTQVIWKNSKELGVGVEIRGNTTWVTAHYNPPGNVQNMYVENVPRILRKN